MPAIKRVNRTSRADLLKKSAVKKSKNKVSKEDSKSKNKMPRSAKSKRSRKTKKA